MPKRQLEKWRKEQRQKTLQDPVALARATQSKLSPLPIQDHRAVLGSLPKLVVNDMPEGKIWPLSRSEKRRNDLLKCEEKIDKERQHEGRLLYKRKRQAASRIQRVYRQWKGTITLADLQAELEKRKVEKRKLQERLKEQVRREQEAAAWLEKVNQLPPTPLRNVLATLHTMEDPFSLSMKGWQNVQADTLSTLQVFIKAQILVLEKCGLPPRKRHKERRHIAQQLGEVLKVQEHLRVFSIRDSQWEALELAVVFQKMFMAGSKILTELDIHGNWLGRGKLAGADDVGNPTFEVNTDATKYLSKLIKLCPDLRVLNLGRNYMGPGAFAAFVNNQGFARPRGLNKIILCYNALGDRLSAAPYSLGHMICACPSLVHLDLQGNALGAHALAVIIKPLALHKFLRELNLADNNLGDRGMALICQMLKTSPSIHRLNLAGNAMSAASYELIGAALSKSPPRQFAHIDLSRNPLSSQDDCIRAMEALAHVIMVNRFLRSITLQRISIVHFHKLQPVHYKEEIRDSLLPVQMLFSTLQSNRYLHLIDLRGNHLDKAVVFPKTITATIIRERIACRPALYFSKASQELVASLFKKYLTETPDPRVEARGGLIDRIVFRILGFAVTERTILI